MQRLIERFTFCASAKGAKIHIRQFFMQYPVFGYFSWCDYEYEYVSMYC